LLHTLSHAPYSKSTSTLAALYQKSGLAAFTSAISGKNLKRLNRLLPTNIEATTWKELYPAIGKTQGRIGLFTGCISRITDSPALDASIRILNKLGYEVVVPAKQGCCGAMHLNGGDSSEANSMAQHNRSVFSELKLDAVVGVASGCISHLNELSEELSLPEPVMDISAFLNTVPGIMDLPLNPLDKKVAIHTPCSMKNVLKQQAAPFELLQLIPELTLIELPENGLCCGAAGTYVIANPKEADALRENKIEGLKASQADILATSNTGCSLHLAAGIRADGIGVEVMHPVELLAQQLAD
jgi:glycolate oxidase iron-sulfur subunit